MVSELQKQIARLKSLPRGEDRPWGTSTEPGLRDELLRVLGSHAQDDAHAQRIVDTIVETADFCPTPAELIRIARATERAQQTEYELTKTRCNDCGDSGFRQVVQVKNGARYEFSQPCDCKKSETLARC